MAAMSDSAPVAARPGRSGRFPVEVGGFSGTLEELVLAAQRGDVDLRDLPVAQVTTQVSRQLTGSDLGGTCAMPRRRWGCWHASFP